jgi:polar amino acid transport system substrate-binding protein
MKQLIRAVAAGAALALVAAGCGSGKSSSQISSVASNVSSLAAGADAAIAAKVPADLKDRTIKVATDASYAPNEFFESDGSTVQGMDVDLGQALGKVMGLEWAFQNAGFDSIIPGLASGKYDVGMSSFTDTKEREQTVDFVTYFSAGTSFYVQASGGPDIAGLASLCGRKVAAERGTTQAADATAQSKKCTAAGNAAVSVSVFPDQNGANLALSSGRADVVMADSPVAAYAVKQSNGQFKLSGQPYGTAPYGIAFPKGSPLAPVTLLALEKLIADGTYLQILKKWGVQDGAITTPTLNGAIS